MRIASFVFLYVQARIWKFAAKGNFFSMRHIRGEIPSNRLKGKGGDKIGRQ